jgi:hypothetical protein
MTEIFQHIHVLLSTSAVDAWMGWMFALSIILGGLLDNKGRDFIGWSVAIVFYAIFNLGASTTYMSSVAVARGSLPVSIEHAEAFVLVTVSFTLTGMFIGWFTVYITKVRLHAKYATKKLARAEAKVAELLNKIDKGSDL